MTKLVRRLATFPVPATLFALGLGLFALGIYIVSPWFTPWESFVFISRHPFIHYGVGALYMLCGMTRVAGAVSKNVKLMLAVPYGMAMGYLFLALMDISVVGWLPLTWLPPVVLSFIGVLCRLSLLYGTDVE